MFNFTYKLFRFCNERFYSGKPFNFVSRLYFWVVLNIYNGILKYCYGAYVPHTVQIGENMNFNHEYFGIFISEKAIIGCNCTIHHHVTIGSSINIITKRRVAPIIGDNVCIGANSTIIGSSKIGHNCVIGPGTTIINANIPNNSIVVPAKNRIERRICKTIVNF